MPWYVVDPTEAAKAGTKVVRVGIPYLPDEIPYEEILGRAFSDPASRDWMASGGVVVIATDGGYKVLQRLMDGAVDMPEHVVRRGLFSLAQDRQAAALRWQSE